MHDLLTLLLSYDNLQQIKNEGYTDVYSSIQFKSIFISITEPFDKC